MDNPTCQSLGLHLWQVVRNPAATPVRVTTKYHDMTSRNNRFSCRIGHEADKHRSQSSVWNQAEIESILLQQTLPSKYKRNSMPRILLTVPQSYYQVKTTPLKFGAIRTKIPNLISTLTTWPTNVGI